MTEIYYALLTILFSVGTLFVYQTRQWRKDRAELMAMIRQMQDRLMATDYKQYKVLNKEVVTGSGQEAINPDAAIDWSRIGGVTIKNRDE